jgi:dATP pyrophosphohydrolase
MHGRAPRGAGEVVLDRRLLLQGRLRRGRYLVIRRRTPYLKGTWQMVSGAVEAGETGWAAALREIEEETGLVPERFY